MKIFNKNIKNAFYSVLDTLFLPLLMVFVTPIFIRYMGIEEYGIWMLINSLIVAISILNIGGVDTVIKYISHYRSSNDYVSINEIFSTVFTTQLFFALIIFIISFYLPSYMIESNIFNIKDEDNQVFKIALQYGILLFALKLVEQISFAYFKGFERFDIASKFSIFSKTMMIIVQLLTVINDGTLSEIFKNSVVFLFILLMCEIIFIKYINKDINFIKNFKMKRIKEILHFTKWSWIISIIATISSQIDRWLLASIASMTLLGYYSLGLLIFNNLHSILASSMSWIFPKVSKEKDTVKIYNYYLILQSILFVVSFFISYVLITFDDIFLYWLKADVFNHSIEYIRNLLVLLPLYSLSIIPFYIVKGTGYIKYNFYSDTITLLIRVVTILLLYKIYGLNGVIIAIGISGLFLVVYLTVVMKIKVLNEYNLKIVSITSLPILYIIMMLNNWLLLKLLVFLLLLFIFYKTFYMGMINLPTYIKRIR